MALQSPAPSRGIEERTSGGRDGLAPAGSGHAVADEVELLRRFRDGDVAAFGELYSRHASAVREVCLGRLRDEHLAEDAVQETFIRAFDALPSYDGRVPVRRWLRRVAKNHCIDVARRAGRMRYEAPEELALLSNRDSVVTAQNPCDSIALRMDVAHLLSGLGARDRELLVSHHGDDVPVDVLARRFQMTTGSMAVALHRARARARGSTSAFALGCLSWRDRFRDWFTLRVTGDVVRGGAMHLTAQVALAATLVLPPWPSEGTHAMSVAGDPARSPNVGSWADVDPDRRPAADHGAVIDRRATPVRALPPSVAPGTDDGRPGDGRLPDTPIRVHRDAPRSEPLRRYGVRAELAGQRADVAVESHEDDELTVADRSACDAMTTAELLTYCER